jgi:hypothetical protein
MACGASCIPVRANSSWDQKGHGGGRKEQLVDLQLRSVDAEVWCAEVCSESLYGPSQPAFGEAVWQAGEVAIWIYS